MYLGGRYDDIGRTRNGTITSLNGACYNNRNGGHYNTP